LPARAQTARDCDDNAVIRCGVVDATDLRQKYLENQAGNTQAIFREFGIGSTTAFDGMTPGRVTSDNKVYIGDRLVGTDAIAAGRQNMPGSTPILGGAAYSRPPSVSFRSPSLDALVKMDGDRMLFAVILSCGNPVKAVPVRPSEQPKQPGFKVVKGVRIRGQSIWHQQVRTQPGDTVEFRILIRNTGQTDFNTVMLRDELPVGLDFLPDSLLINGLATTNVQESVDIGALQAGAQHEVVLAARVISTVAEGTCTTLTNTASVKPDTLPSEQSSAVVEVCRKVRPRPVTPAVVQPPPPTVVQPPPAERPVVTPPALPSTGPEDVAALVTLTSIIGAAVYKLKDFYLLLLR
jgi:uncharacterized repeat protein (TIGR01451 family)